MARQHRSFCLLSAGSAQTQYDYLADRLLPADNYARFVIREVDKRVKNLREEGWNITTIWDHRGAIYGSGWREDSSD